jgi:hypothetical protein
MSVTFTFGEYVEDAKHGVILVHGIDCRHGCDSPEPCEYYAIYRTCDHREDAIAKCGCEAFDVNMSNANALAVLERLGLPADYADLAGSASPDDFSGRALVANIGRDDSGIPVTESQEPGCATVIDCGIDAGYFEDRMSALAGLAAEAAKRQMLVVWA